MAGIIRKAQSNDAVGITTVKVRSWQAAYKGIVHQAYLDAMDIPKMAQRTESWLSVPDAPDEHWVYDEAGRIGGWACMWWPTRDEISSAVFSHRTGPEPTAASVPQAGAIAVTLDWYARCQGSARAVEALARRLANHPDG